MRPALARPVARGHVAPDPARELEGYWALRDDADRAAVERRAQGWAVVYTLVMLGHSPDEPLHAVGCHTAELLLGGA